MATPKCPNPQCGAEWTTDTIRHWDADLPTWNNDSDENIDFCTLKCHECDEKVVQCRYCKHNIRLEGKEYQEKRNRSPEAWIKKKMRDHMAYKNQHAGCDYIDPFVSIPAEEDCFPNYNNGIEFEVGEDANIDWEQYLGCPGDGDDANEPTRVILEPTVTEKEEEEANIYTSQFTNRSDLNPDTPGEDEWDSSKDEVHEYEYEGNDDLLNPTSSANQKFKYSDFSFFDFRTEDEKIFRKGQSRQRICQSQLYFYQRYLLQLVCENDGTGGFAGLVYRAQDGNREDTSNPYYNRYLDWQNNTSTGSNPIDELKQMHRMMNILIDLSDSQKKDFLEFNAESMNLHKVASISHGVKLHYPTDIAEARRMILDGAHSIMKNLPVPRVFEISGHEDGLLGTASSHSCVSLKEVLLIAAGHGTKFNFAYDPTRADHDNYDGLNGTDAVKDLRKDVVTAMTSDNQSRDKISGTKIGYIYFWSDSFLRCFIKQRENSVWVLTVTICPPESDKTNGNNTFILAIGKSGKEVDHRPVIEHYIKECIELMKGFDCYFGESNTIGRMAVGMLLWSADRPERQMINNIKIGGNYGKISGWSALVSEQYFPACMDCHKRRVGEMLGVSMDDEASYQCDKCLDWTLDPDQCDDADKLKMFEKPPKEYPGDRSESPDLPKGREPGLNWLGPIKLSTDWMRQVLRTAYRGRRYWRWTKATTEAYLGSCNVGGAAGEKVESLAKRDKDNGNISETSDIEPGIWNLLDVFARYQTPDLPMHGLAHGTIPDSDNINQKIFKNHGLCARYYTMANKIISDVASFRLDWCKVKTLPKAAWIGENSMAYMRLMSYLYGMFLPTAVDKITEKTVDNMKRFVNSLQALMSVLMSTAEPVESTTENHLKLFMSSADFLHKDYGSLADKSKGTKNRAVDKLNFNELQTILPMFDIDDSVLVNESVPALRNLLHAIKVDDLKKKCRELRLEDKGLKAKLQDRLFEKILGDRFNDETILDEVVDQDMVDEPDELERVEGANIDPDGMCWNRGNWLSFLANIPGQMKYLGPLPWIW